MEEGLRKDIGLFLPNIIFFRSLGRYSSEEESDSDIKVNKKKDSRRITMATSVMQPPSSNVKIRKSTRLNDTPETQVCIYYLMWIVLG